MIVTGSGERTSFANEGKRQVPIDISSREIRLGRQARPPERLLHRCHDAPASTLLTKPFQQLTDGYDRRRIAVLKGFSDPPKLGQSVGVWCSCS